MTDSNTPDIPDDVWDLLESLCEDRLTPAAQQRLDDLVVSNRDVRRLYVDYMMLHGSLHWDAASSTDDFPSAAATPHSTPVEIAEGNSAKSGDVGSPRRYWLTRGILLLSACLLVGIGALAQHTFFSDEDGRTASRSDKAANAVVKTSDDDRTPPRKVGKSSAPDSIGRNRTKIVRTPGVPKRGVEPRGVVHRVPIVAAPPRPRPFVVPDGGSSHEDVVAFVDQQIKTRWQDDGVTPSDRASDGAWLRRVTLDIIGRIPTADEVERFLADPNPDKRRFAVDRLLNDPKYVRNWTTIWSNLLVGRRPSPDVDRPALEKFLRDSFAQNRPWKDVVVDLVSAEGDGSENGAANFLIAHLNNQAVPATAITARLFLGTQVQCTQCHNHPFNNWKQSQFWELNGCFQQTAVERRKSPDKNRKRRVVLVNRPVGGPIFYPERSNLLKAAFPKFEGRQIDASAGVNRRAELSRLIFESEKKLVAKAMVNRMWAHFFGHGFTRRVDDMGPHSPPSHPELLNRLADEFVESRYDIKRLVRWICNSRPYQLSSRFNDTNTEDNPAAGLPPSFSRMYVKAMSAEQLYDSLLVATRAERAGTGNWDEVVRQRREWLQQFVITFGTDENDEASTFDGTIPQALMLMNSSLVEDAVSGKPGTFFHRVITENRPEKVKVRMLALAALSREPTERENTAFRRALSRPVPRGVNRQKAKAETLQDIFWAFLNSNEFILIH